MLEDFMERLSRDMELEEPLKAQLPNVYTLFFDEGYSVSIASTSSSNFTLSCTLGDCPNNQKEAFFTKLLLANLFGKGTLGAVLGMDIDASKLILTQNIDYHIEYKTFRDTVEDFLNVADFWRQEVLTANSL